MTQQLWGGRFGPNAGKTNDALTELNCSLPLDARLFADDIDGSKAYAEALELAGYLTFEEKDMIVKGLEIVRFDWIEKSLTFLSSDEDVHTVNERRLTEIIGKVAGKLHAGRSRNDQVITDMKLWMRKAIREIIFMLHKVIVSIMKQAEQNIGILMPGYTHLQRAQAIQFSHWILSHAFALREDCLRLCELKDRSNILPLGSGALAGNPLGIDRIWLAERLGFTGITANSMHAVGDRDFVADFIYCCSIISLHLSRLAEDLVIFSTKEFNFIKIADEMSTGSSLMPQKRNPDSLELVRGLAGAICSSLTGMMITIKGLPSTYNKDLQFDKSYCFQAFDKVKSALSVTDGVITTMKINQHQMESALSTDMLATDWAYYLVRKGVSFRKAHHIIGSIVALAESKGIGITEIPLGQLQGICPKFDIDISMVADYITNVEKYNVIGGTAISSIRQQLNVLQKFCTGLQIFK